MGFLKFCLLVTLTVFLSSSLWVRKSEAMASIDITAAISGNRSILNEITVNSIEEFKNLASLKIRDGPLGEATKLLTDGWVQSIKLVGEAGGKTFDLIDKTLNKSLGDKIAARNAINNGILDVGQAIFQAGTSIHYSLGAAMATANYGNEGGIKYFIDKIQDTGTALFDQLDVVQFFALQAINADNDELRRKYCEAARSEVVLALTVCNNNFLDGGKNFLEYLSKADELSLKHTYSISEDDIYEKARAAVANSSVAVAAMDQLNKGLDIASTIAGSPALDKLKNGLLQYLQSSVKSASLSTDVFTRVKELANSNPQAASGLIKDTIQSSKVILIDGSVQAYIGIGSAGKLSGLDDDKFKSLIEIVENSRIEGTKILDLAEKILTMGIKSGGTALDQSFDSAHLCIDVFESKLISQLYDVRDSALRVLESIKQPTENLEKL